MYGCPENLADGEKKDLTCLHGVITLVEIAGFKDVS